MRKKKKKDRALSRHKIDFTWTSSIFRVNTSAVQEKLPHFSDSCTCEGVSYFRIFKSRACTRKVALENALTSCQPIFVLRKLLIEYKYCRFAPCRILRRCPLVRWMECSVQCSRDAVMKAVESWSMSEFQFTYCISPRTDVMIGVYWCTAESDGDTHSTATKTESAVKIEKS